MPENALCPSAYPSMLHMFGAQRTSVDDRRGVEEALNETTCDCHDCECPVRAGLAIRGQHLISLQPRNKSAQRRRTLEQEANNPPILIFTEPRRSTAATKLAASLLQADKGQQVSAEATEDGYSYQLPANVQLLTLMETEEGTVMLRLAHIYEAGEGGTLGEPACVDVAALLGTGRALELREVSLTGAALEPRLSGRRWWSGSTPRRSSDAHQVPEPRCTGGKLVVALKPMQIRTWEVTLGGEATHADDAPSGQQAVKHHHRMDEVDRRVPETV